LKAIGFPLDRSQEWGELDKYRMLRVCIVHKESKPDGKTLLNYINRKKCLSLQRDEVILDKGFCEETLEVVFKFFDTLLAALENWKNMRGEQTTQ